MVILTSVLRILINNPVKKNFYKKKKKINILTIFFISIKVISKLFKNRLFSNVLKTLR